MSNTAFNRAVDADWNDLLSLIELDGDDDDDFRAQTAEALLLFESNKQSRNVKWNNERLNWNEHVQRELHTMTFESKYHMSLSAFNKLVALLRKDVTVDFIKSMNSTQGNTPIYPELIVAMGLRYLGGSLVKDLEDIFGVDHASVPRVIDMFFDAILGNETLAIRLPCTTTDLEELSNGFSSISGSDHLFDGCIGAIDGWLCSTIQPIDTTITNKRDYFSGHYQCFGLNIQAICDSKLRFIYFAVAAPGKTGDHRALMKCLSFGKWKKKYLENTRYFLVGDNAYLLHDALLIPFSGNHMTEAQRTYNFFLSQMRIRIEMAFGRLTTKWRVFRRKLENSMRRNSTICQVAAVLHNYVINECGEPNEEAEDFITEYPNAPNNLGYLPVNGDDENNNGEWMETRQGSSPRRTAFVRIIQRDGMNRPSYNKSRNG